MAGANNPDKYFCFCRSNIGDEYRANEFENFMPVKVSRGTGVTIANPITLRITPLTVQQALERNLIDESSLPVISFISPNRAGKR